MCVATIYVTIGAPGGSCRAATPSPPPQAQFKDSDGVDTIISKVLRDLHFCLKQR